MATYGSGQVGFVLIDGYSLAPYLTELEDGHEAKTEDTTVLTLSAVTHGYAGLEEFKLSLKGFYDDATGASDAALCTGVGVRRVVNYAVEGNTVGKAMVGFAGALQGSYRRGAKNGELHKASVDFKGAGEVEEGYIIAPLAARTTAGNTTATKVNCLASGTGGVAFLQCTALTLGGYTNLAIKLQDSANGTDFADITGGAFTALTAAPGKQRLAIAGAIRQYVAVAWSYVGAGSNPTGTWFVGLHKHVDPV
jgi:hypothetical protein